MSNLTTLAIAAVDTVNAADNGSLDQDVIGIINNVIAVLGLVCVIVIIIGGVNYMTSSGDATKTKKAKDTILYGIVGLIICVLAFGIVNFVIANILGQKSNDSDDAKSYITREIAAFNQLD